VGCYDTSMGTLREANPNARELLTEILDKTRWWSTLNLIMGFLHSKRVERVRIEFGFVLDRDLQGNPKLRTRSFNSTIWKRSSRRASRKERLSGLKARTFAFRRSVRTWLSCSVTMPIYTSPLLIHRCSWNSGAKSSQAESRLRIRAAHQTEIDVTSRFHSLTPTGTHRDGSDYISYLFGVMIHD